tara:strand:- start:290 stop:1057 length:768 start_codon:yes stop_codon:yes gene_type:complete
MKMYKVLLNDMKSPWQKMQYQIGKSYTCSDFDTNWMNECSKGFYATEIEGLPDTYYDDGSRVIYECNVSGKKVEINQYKKRYEVIELTRKMEKEEIISEAKKIELDLGYNLSEILYPVNPGKTEPAGRNDLEDLFHRWIELQRRNKSMGRNIGADLDYYDGNASKPVINCIFFATDTEIEHDEGKYPFVYAYISSLFPSIKKWRGIEHKEGENPYQSGIDLWRSGYIPTKDRTSRKWQLRKGKDYSVVLEENHET